MTIGELKKKIKDVPDDVEVILAGDLWENYHIKYVNVGDEDGESVLLGIDFETPVIFKTSSSSH